MGLIFATGIVAIMCVFLAGVFAASLPLAAIYIFVITVVSVYYGTQYFNYFYLLFAINFSVILAYSHVPTWHENIKRILIILGVTLIATFFQLILIRGFSRRKVRMLSVKSLYFLGLISKEIFSCFLQAEYPDNIYLFERRIHVRKKKYMLNMERLRFVAHQSEDKSLADKIDALFDALMNCAILRGRVSDHTVFSLCTQELQAISNEINSVIHDIILMIKNKKTMIDTLVLSERIELLENNYNNILRVTAREPLAFLLFIAGLKEIKKEMDKF